MAQPPPYVNPLTAEQFEGLRISEIRFEHLKDGSIDAEKAAKVAALLRLRLTELLSAKLAPANGNAVLVVRLQLVFGTWGADHVSLQLDGSLEGAGLLRGIQVGRHHGRHAAGTQSGEVAGAGGERGRDGARCCHYLGSAALVLCQRGLGAGCDENPTDEPSTRPLVDLRPGACFAEIDLM
jgi:hypothetical protein